MKKYRIFLTLLLFAVLGILGLHIRSEYKDSSSRSQSEQNEKITQADDSLSLSASANDAGGERLVCPSGEPIGIYVKTKGVMVVGVGEVEDIYGKTYKPCQNLLHAGDYILKINGEEIKDKASMISQIQECDGNPVLLQICRDSELFDISVTPVKDKKGNYVLGLWVKDDISGIGTLTFTENGKFAALGHSINDSDTGTMMQVSDGALYETAIVNIRKPSENTPGRLEGVIDYTSRYVIGRVEENSSYGIHGYLTERQKKMRQEENWMPVASRKEVHTGKAFILSSVSGESKYYEIEILSVDVNNENGKCMEFEVKDEELLELTGGIVQGMSGTPIIQDGKLVGAVTHVFVNHPEKGYGVFIEEML